MARNHKSYIGFAFVTIALIFILIFTLITSGNSKTKTKNCFRDREQVQIECLGDSITEGYPTDTVTYPAVMENELYELFAADGQKYRFKEIETVNYGRAGSILYENTYKNLSGHADIVIVLYTANNFMYEVPYEGTLEANVSALKKTGADVFLMNYPILEGSSFVGPLISANKYIGQVSASMDVPLIDMYSYMKNNYSDVPEKIYTSDNIHLTERGYAYMGKYAAAFIHDYYSKY